MQSSTTHDTQRKWAQPRYPLTGDGQTARASVMGRHAAKKNGTPVRAHRRVPVLPSAKPARPTTRQEAGQRRTGPDDGARVTMRSLWGKHRTWKRWCCALCERTKSLPATSALRWSVSWNGNLLPVPTLTSQSCNFC